MLVISETATIQPITPDPYKFWMTHTALDIPTGFKLVEPAVYVQMGGAIAGVKTVRGRTP